MCVFLNDLRRRGEQAFTAWLTEQAGASRRRNGSLRGSTLALRTTEEARGCLGSDAQLDTHTEEAGTHSEHALTKTHSLHKKQGEARFGCCRQAGTYLTSKLKSFSRRDLSFLPLERKRSRWICAYFEGKESSYSFSNAFEELLH